MKCLILAGGKGERLWPLSRKNYPKQFIQIKKNHSLFQETVVRNLVYCDEFIIVTNYEYRHIIESQMKSFQGVTYRCVYEMTPRKTAAAITLACMDLQPSELVYVVAADHLIDTELLVKNGLSYRESVLSAKKLAINGGLAVFGIKAPTPEKRFGWIRCENDKVVEFIAKPNKDIGDDYLQNAGLLLFENGMYLEEVKHYMPVLADTCNDAFRNKRNEGNATIYDTKWMERIPAYSIEEAILEKSTKLEIVKCGFEWNDVGRLEDLADTAYDSSGHCIKYESDSAEVINNCDDQIVVLNNVEDLMVVNTNDAVYIGRYGDSCNLKDIIPYNNKFSPYFEKSKMFYRSWGFYEQLFGDSTYRIRRIVLYPGKTIYAHSHNLRSENLTVVSGVIAVTLNDVPGIYNVFDNISINVGVTHQISNVGTEIAICVETACGEIIHADNDITAANASDLNESQLGMAVEPFVKMTPVFKDYLWGGNKLREKYNKICDYEKIAESWELSAHCAGQSIVASGRHKGMQFGQYLDIVGKEVLGWKCQSMTEFPILIKLIDAKENLSVQVHPNDDYAMEYEKEYGKNEMWYILDCEPDASLYVGFSRDVSREEVAKRIEDNTILEVLNKVETHPGDVFFIPAGTVHAIGAGNLICEIQQSSNSTYRLYDYDRRDKYGNPRELHLDKALDVLDYKKYIVKEKKVQDTLEKRVLCQCKYFEVVTYDIIKELQLCIDESSFVSIVCLTGSGAVSSGDLKQKLEKGDCLFVSAKEQKLVFEGNMRIIVSFV